MFLFFAVLISSRGDIDTEMSIEDGMERGGRWFLTIQVMPEDIRKDYPWAFEKAQSCQHLDLKLLTPPEE